MQVVDAVVVERELVLLPVEGEPALADAVRAAAHRRAEIVFVHLVARVIPVAENDVGQLSIAVGREDRHEVAAEVGRGHLHAVFVPHRIKGRLSQVGHQIGGLGDRCHLYRSFSSSLSWTANMLLL